MSHVLGYFGLLFKLLIFLSYCSSRILKMSTFLFCCWSLSVFFSA